MISHHLWIWHGTAAAMAALVNCAPGVPSATHSQIEDLFVHARWTEKLPEVPSFDVLSSESKRLQRSVA